MTLTIIILGPENSGKSSLGSRMRKGLESVGVQVTDDGSLGLGMSWEDIGPVHIVTVQTMERKVEEEEISISPPTPAEPPEGWTPSYPGDQSWRGKGYNPGTGYDG